MDWTRNTTDQMVVIGIGGDNTGVNISGAQFATSTVVVLFGCPHVDVFYRIRLIRQKSILT